MAGSGKAVAGLAGARLPPPTIVNGMFLNFPQRSSLTEEVIAAPQLKPSRLSSCADDMRIFERSEHDSPAEDEEVLPLWSETLDVTKRGISTGRASVSTVTRSRKELIEELLTREHADIERVEIRLTIASKPSATP